MAGRFRIGLPMRNFLSVLLACCCVFSVQARAEKVRFLLKDQEALQARVDIIQQAKKEILIEYFSIWDDDQSVGAISLLIDAARRGVKVKIIVDSLSNTIPLSLFGALAGKGIGPDGQRNLEVKVYNPASLNFYKMTHRNHSKMMIIDANILLTGGRNLGDKYFGMNKKRNFHDLDILLQGNVAIDARENFLQVWKSEITKPPRLHQYASDRVDPAFCAYSDDHYSCLTYQRDAQRKMAKQTARLTKAFEDILNDKASGNIKANTKTDWFRNSYTIKDVNFMSHKPDTLVSSATAYLTHDLEKALAAARSSVDIVSPYLMPPPDMFAILKKLTAKGVRVRVITNSLKSTDNLFAQAGYRYMKSELVAAGLEIYEYIGPDTIHGKTALIDKKQVLVGTFNIDPRSSYLNREVGVSLIDSKNVGLAKELDRITEDFVKQSMLVAKNRKEYNLEWQEDGVGYTKLATLRALILMAPAMINQL